MGDKPIIRIAVPGQTAEDFMQAAAKQFRGDFFVAIDQPVGKHVRIEAPFLDGGVGVRGDAIAMPAVRNGRKGLVIRLVKLDADSLGIPIPEPKEPVAQLGDDEEPNEFELGQSTVASNVSAAVAESIRATASASQPIKPIKPGELDAETREAVDEFSDMSTRASEITDEMAKKLTERSVPPATTPKAAHVVRRTTPESGIPVKPAPVLRKIEDEPEDPDKLERDARRHTRPTAQLSALVPDNVELPATDDQPVEVPAPIEEPVEAEDAAAAADAAPAPAQASKGATAVLIVLILLTLAAAAYVLVTSL